MEYPLAVPIDRGVESRGRPTRSPPVPRQSEIVGVE
jgi:hypothetical protein